jgi:hypothetical protein
VNTGATSIPVDAGITGRHMGLLNAVLERREWADAVMNGGFFPFDDGQTSTSLGRGAPDPEGMADEAFDPCRCHYQNQYRFNPVWGRGDYCASDVTRGEVRFAPDLVSFLSSFRHAA